MENKLVDRATERTADRGWDARLWIAVGLVLLGAVLNTLYLFHHSPIELSEDEAHYWEWSRHLDYGYYSKPPGIAWVIWAAIRVGGMLGINGDGSGRALMPVMRMAAVIFGVVSGLLSLFLARRMFKNAGALAVILLSAAVPMFAVGSLLITIDSPMYMCWAATVYCLWRAVEAGAGGGDAGTRGRGDAAKFEQIENRKSKIENQKWLYAAGICSAMGMLFKPVLVAIPICAVIAAWADRGAIRRAFKTWHAAGAFLIMLCSQIPVIVWNSRHGWVMFRHILTQGGVGKQAGAVPPHKSVVQAVLLDPLSRLAEYIGGQAGGMAGIMFALLVIAVIVAWKKVRLYSPRLAGGNPAPTVRERLEGIQSQRIGSIAAGKPAAICDSDSDPLIRSRWIFLLSFTLPLWAFYFVMNLWKRTEVNWPAASYFTGMILLAGVFAEGWNAGDPKNRRAWRTWGSIAIAWGVLLTAGIMNTYRLYPLAAEKLAPLENAGTMSKYFSSWWHPKQWEKPIFDKLRGMQARADAVEKIRADLAEETRLEPLIITGRYDTSSSLAFYMPGHPFLYCIMSSVGGRESQYDLWPGLNQQTGGKPAFLGKPAIIIGIDGPAFDSVVRPAFEKVEGPELVPIKQNGIILKQMVIYRAWGFKGHIKESSQDAY